MAALLLTNACAKLLHRPGNSAINTPAAKNPGLISQGPVTNIASGERLGTVHVIGTAQRFVLVQTASGQNLSMLVDGQALVCRSAGNVTATLRISRERRPPFVVADVATGEPHVGDEVFIDTAPGRAALSPPPGASPGSPMPSATPEFRTDPALPPTR